MNYCPYCGTSLQAGMRFCPKCGEKLCNTTEADTVVVVVKQESASATPECAEHMIPSAGRENEAPAQQVKGSRGMRANGNSQAQEKKKRWIVVVCLFVAIVIVGVCFVGNSSGTDITEAANSVLFLEVYNDREVVTSTASGFVIEDGTTLVTNYHVIKDAYHIVAWTPDGEKAVDISTILAYDKDADIAILKCDENIGVQPLELADSESVAQGDAVYAVGYPLGVAHTLSDGVVSSRYIDEFGTDILQITAAISGGSSGGALFSEAGEIVGVVCASYANGQNMNLAIASNVVSDLLKQNEDTVPLAMSEYYAGQSRIGISANNLLGGCMLTHLGTDIFYVDHAAIYRYDRDANSRVQIAQGNCVNVYKEKLYYSTKDSVFCCDFDGTNESKLDLPLGGFTEDDKISSILFFDGYLLVEVVTVDWFDYHGVENALYIIDLNTNMVVNQISGQVNYTYYKNCIYVGMRGNGILEIDMDSFEERIFPTSFEAYIRGVRDDGVLYYTDNYEGMSKGFYSLDIQSGKEHHEQMFRDEKGKTGMMSVGHENVFISVMSDVPREASNYYIDKQGTVYRYDYDGWIVQMSTIPGIDYVYLWEGTTIDLSTGRDLGQWVFT